MQHAAMPVALVTGANTGIGLSVARRLAELGQQVVIGSRSLARGEDAVRRLGDDGLGAVAVELDITENHTVEAARDLIAERFGRLDVLVNNAAIKLEVSPSPPSACPLDLVRLTLDTNVLGTIRVTLAMLPLLRLSGAPRIVNVSSSMGSLGLATTAGSAQMARPLLSYNVSKAAINSATVQFANELRDTVFKVNAADPGYTATRMTSGPGNRPTDRSADEAAEVIVHLATLGPDGPTGGFFDERGRLPW